MSSYTEAFQKPTAEEIGENQQNYEHDVRCFDHVKSARHILGVYGGNEVSGIQGSKVDLESDLLGITRPTPRANERQHQPLQVDQFKIIRKNPKGSLTLNITPVHLPTYQMWPYPATVAPRPFMKKTCDRPEKF